MNEDMRRKKEEAFLLIERKKRELEEKIERQKKEAALLLKQKNEAKKREKELLKSQKNQKSPVITNHVPLEFHVCPSQPIKIEEINAGGEKNLERPLPRETSEIIKPQDFQPEKPEVLPQTPKDLTGHGKTCSILGGSSNSNKPEEKETMGMSSGKKTAQDLRRSKEDIGLFVNPFARAEKSGEEKTGLPEEENGKTPEKTGFSASNALRKTLEVKKLIGKSSGFEDSQRETSNAESKPSQRGEKSRENTERSFEKSLDLEKARTVLNEKGSEAKYEKSQAKTPQFQEYQTPYFPETYELDPVKSPLKASKISANDKKPFIIKRIKLKEAVLAYEAKFKSEEFNKFLETAHFPGEQKAENPPRKSQEFRKESDEKIEENIEIIEETTSNSQEIPQTEAVDSIKLPLNREKTPTFMIPAEKLKKREVSLSALSSRSQEKQASLREIPSNNYMDASPRFPENPEKEIEKPQFIKPLKEEVEKPQLLSQSSHLSAQNNTETLENYPEEDLYLKEIDGYEEGFSDPPLNQPKGSQTEFPVEKLPRIEENQDMSYSAGSDSSFEKAIQESRVLFRKTLERSRDMAQSSINIYESPVERREEEDLSGKFFNNDEDSGEEVPMGKDKPMGEISEGTPQKTEGKPSLGKKGKTMGEIEGTPQKTEEKPNFIKFEIDVIEDEELKAKKLRVLERRKQKKLEEIETRKKQNNLQETAKFGGEGGYSNPEKNRLRPKNSPSSNEKTEKTPTNLTPIKRQEKPPKARHSLSNSFSLKEEHFTSKFPANKSNNELKAMEGEPEKRYLKTKSQIIKDEKPKMTPENAKLKGKVEERKSVTPKPSTRKSFSGLTGSPEESRVLQSPANLSLTPRAGKRALPGQKFTKSSNFQLIRNAIANVCLAGEHNKKEREAVLARIAELKAEESISNLIVIFKGSLGRQDFKGLYCYDPGKNEVSKVIGRANLPGVLEKMMVVNYYRYDTGAKEFKVIPANKDFSIAVDAVSLGEAFFKNAPFRNNI